MCVNSSEANAILCVCQHSRRKQIIVPILMFVVLRPFRVKKKIRAFKDTADQVLIWFGKHASLAYPPNPNPVELSNYVPPVCHLSESMAQQSCGSFIKPKYTQANFTVDKCCLVIWWYGNGGGGGGSGGGGIVVVVAAVLVVVEVELWW